MTREDASAVWRAVRPVRGWSGVVHSPVFGGTRGAPAIMAIALLVGCIWAGVSTGPVDRAGGGDPRPSSALGPDSTIPITGTVYGKVGSCATCAAVPLSADTVDAVASTCPVVETDAGACTPVASAITNAAGGYTLSVPSGTSYYVYSTPISGYGGDSVKTPVVSSEIIGQNLYAYDQLPYSNQTFVLPGYVSLSSYLYTPNGNTQVPVVSFSADGVYYVNASSDLVFYSFVTEQTKLIASWTQLYAPRSYAGEEQNAFFLTLDGAYAYELGCLASCSSGSSVVVHAVNITTGSTFVWTLSGVDYGALSSNVQVNMIGFNGNDSIMAILTSETSAPVYAYNIWNSTQWALGNLNYFEANNCYWVPSLDSYIDIQAGGSRADGIQQFQLQQTDGGWVHLSEVFHDTSYPGGGVVANWVNGLTLNLTLGELSYSYGYTVGGTIVSAVYAFGSNGILSHRVNAVKTALLQGLAYADEHRLELTTGAPTPEGYFSPYFYNQSWVIDPFTSSTTYYDTTVTEGKLYSCSSTPACGLPSIGVSSTAGPVASHYFLNGSYAIGGYSVDCDAHCPLLGTTPGTSLGTVYWLWNSHLPEFPYPSSADLAQATPGVLTLSNSTTGSSVTIMWSLPAQYPVANYTFFWGTGAGVWTHILNLSSTASGYTITGLSRGETVYYGAEVWNLHFHSPLATGRATAETPPDAPTGLSVSSFTTTSIGLSWNNPPGTLVNDTVFYGTVCGAYPAHSSTGGAARTATITGLIEDTTYCFAVAAWNASGMSPLSGTITATPGVVPSAPSSLHATATTTTSVSLAWTEPSGTVLNDSVYAGTSCGAWNIGVGSTGGAAVSYTVSGLTAGASYCFAVTAWNATGQSAPSLPVTLITAHVPSAPIGIVVGAITSTTVQLSWTNPTGTLTGDTVFEAASSFDAACPSSGGYQTSYRIAAATGYTVTGLVSGNFYCFAVAAWNATGMSALDPTGTAVQTLHVPPAPTALRVPSATTTTLFLAWTNPLGNVTNVTVLWGSTCGDLPNSRSLEGSGTSYTITALNPGTRYCVTVVAWNATGMSVPGGPVVAATRPLPSAPALLGLPAVEGFALLIASGVVLGSLGLAFAVRRRRKGRSPPGPPVRPPTSTPSIPPRLR